MLGSLSLIARIRSDSVSRKSIRYAIGMVILFAISFSYNWPLSFLIIILGHSFLLGSRPTFKFAVEFVVKFAISLIFSIALSHFFLEYDVLYIMLIGIILLYIFYADPSVLSPLLKMALILLTLVVPFISLKSLSVGSMIGWAVVLAAFISVFTAILMFILIPDLESDSDQGHHGHNSSDEISEYERFKNALKTFAIVYPILVLFYYSNFQGDIVMLVYIGIYSSTPNFSKDLSLGRVMIIGCIAGGLLAFLIYEILVIIPLFSFFLLLIFGLTLALGHHIIKSGKYAEYIKKGFSAFIIILGTSLTSLGADAGGKVFIRIIQISFVIIYLVLALRLIDSLFPRKLKKA